MPKYKIKYATLTKYGQLDPNKIYNSDDYEENFWSDLKNAGRAVEYISDEEIIDSDEDINTKVEGLSAELAQNTSRINNIRVTPEQFGAIGDGLTNDTQALQDAIDYVISEGGGTVYCEKQYVVCPSAIGNTGALYIRDNNVRIVGKGLKASKIKFLTYNMQDPTTTSYTFNSSKWRGRTFAIDNGAATITGLVFKDIEIDGSVSNVDADTFDQTNKIIGAVGSTIIDGLLIENCHIHNAFGELVYSGGEHGKAIIKNNIFENTKANGVTFSGEVIFESNVVKNARKGGTEQALWENKPCVYKNNIYLENNNYHLGTQHGSPTSEFPTNLSIENNLFGYSSFNKNNGVSLTSVNGVSVRGNKFVDCSNDPGYGAIVLTNNTAYLPTQILENIVIENNELIADKKSVSRFFRIAPTTPQGKTIAMKNVHIKNNKSFLTDYAKNNGFTIGGFEVYDLPYENVVIKENELFGFKQYDINGYYTSTSKVYEKTLPKGFVKINAAFNLSTSTSCRIYARYNTKSGYIITDIINLSNVTGVQTGSVQIYLDRTASSAIEIWVYCPDVEAKVSFEINQ